MRNLVLALALVAAWGTVTSTQAAPTGFASSNVEHVATIPLEAGAPTGARLVGDYLYVAGAKSFSIYDVTDPLDPQLLSITPVGFYFANEDVDTNGEILLLSSDTVQDELYVWDVEDKTKPELLATVPGVRDHNFACVFDCTWAYGTRGSIVDLRDPTSPEVAGSWGGGQNPNDGYDTTEVARGRVLTATRALMLLDARRNVRRPELLALGASPDNRLMHSVRWPREMKDRFILVQGETFGPSLCSGGSGAFMTWDATRWAKTHTFQMIDEYRVSNGSYADGSPPANAVGCTAMWFQEHPDFHNGGLVTAGFFDHGTRFLEVAGDGGIEEVGYFMPVGGETIASYWITDRIVYSIDLVRGIDILRYNP